MTSPPEPRSVLSAEDRGLLDACLAGTAGAWDKFVGRFAGLFAFIASKSARQRGLALAALGFLDRLGDRRLVVVIDSRIAIVTPVVDILLKLVIGVEVVSVAGHGSCEREGVRERQRGSLSVAPYVGRCR